MTVDPSLPPFPGFTDDALSFLRDLSAHNERAWFTPRKKQYVDLLKDPLDLLVAETSGRLGEAGLPIARGRAFRIYRDVRFSTDKSPYQTHASAAFECLDDDPVLLYVHIAPGSSFVAAGVYRPPTAYLAPVRRTLVERPEWFLAVRGEVEAKGLDVGPAGTVLTGMPWGFAAHRDTPMAEVLRWQSIIAQRSLSDDELLRPGLAADLVSAAVDALPLLEFLWRVSEDAASA